MRLVSPETAKAVPMTTEPKINQTEGSKKSFRACIGGADHKDGLEQADGDGGGADGHHLKDPPDRGHEKEADGHAALGRQGKVLARGVHRVRLIPT